MFNKDQLAAINAAKKGHSVMLTGSAGTGKTVTIKGMMDEFKKQDKRVMLCCATGIACLPLSHLSAQTVHRAFGLKDGRYSEEQLKALFSDESDHYYATRRKTIEEADVVVIDEIR